MDNRLLSLLQLCDSNFPSGAFSHSYGLETYIQEEAVYNKDTFFQWLRIFLEKQLIFTDGLGCRFALDKLDNGDIHQIWNLDQLLYVQNIAEEAREANRRIGERMIRMGFELYTVPLLELYVEKIRAKEAFGHPALAFSIIGHFLHIEKEQIVLTLLYSTMASLVQNGVRGIPIGQTDGQKILLELQPNLLAATKKIVLLNQDDFGAAAPGLEIAQMRHERLPVRLFMS